MKYELKYQVVTVDKKHNHTVWRYESHDLKGAEEQYEACLCGINNVLVELQQVVVLKEVERGAPVLMDTTEIHDGHDCNEEPCKYEVVEKDGKLVSINGHKMYKSPVEYDGSSSLDRCYICSKQIKKVTDDVTWWTDGSHLCKHNEPFYFTNGGGCMDILIGKDCQKKHGLIE